MWLLFVINLFAECDTNIRDIEIIAADGFGLKYSIVGEFNLEGTITNNIVAYSQPATMLRHIYLFVKDEVYHCYTFNMTSENIDFYEAVIARCVCRSKIRIILEQAWDEYSENYELIFKSPAWRR